MDNVKLLNRTDKKYMLPINKLEIFLEQIKDAYRVLEINGIRINSYCSFYYDTPDFDLYKAHHNKKLNRLKIRFRSYIQSKIHFLEIKLKTNKGRTIKKRIDVSTPNIFSETEENFIRQYYNFDKPLINTINIEYQRITLVNKELTERITIDINLLLKTDKESKILSNIAIVEIKQDDYKKLSQAELVLKNMRIKEGFMSKYCLGMALLKPVKQNLFKSKIRNIIKTNAYV
ncbi:MAG: polyphosphate polymerase domain-containing protein [Bacteroidia bacterium]